MSHRRRGFIKQVREAKGGPLELSGEDGHSNVPGGRSRGGEGAQCVLHLKCF